MNALTLVSVLLLVSLSAVADPLSTTGTAACDRQSPKNCRVAWKFAAAPAASYSVEQFDPGAKNWKTIYGPVSDASGAMEEPAPEGFMYRAVACGDRSRCTVSTALWAPIHPGNTGAMPETLLTKEGYKMTVQKDFSYEAQRQQYNVYKLYQLLEIIEDWSIMPPMTEPPKDPLVSQPEWVDDDLIHYVTYGRYESARSGIPIW